MSNEALDEARRLLAQPSLHRPALTRRSRRDARLAHRVGRHAGVLVPILGPSATLILHRLGGYAADGESVWTPHEFAATFGLGTTITRPRRSLSRPVGVVSAWPASTRSDRRAHPCRTAPGALAARLPGLPAHAYHHPVAA